MGYLESIFERVETQVKNPTKDNIQDWLSGKGTTHEKRREGYSDFAGELRKPFDIREAAREEADLEKLRELQKEARRLRFEDTETEEVVKTSIDTAVEVEKEEDRITKEVQSYANELDKIKSLSREEIRDLYKSGNKEERVLAGVALGETSYQTLGGLVRGEQRRAQRAIRLMFG